MSTIHIEKSEGVIRLEVRLAVRDHVEEYPQASQNTTQTPSENGLSRPVKISDDLATEIRSISDLIFYGSVLGEIFE